MIDVYLSISILNKFLKKAFLLTQNLIKSIFLKNPSKKKNFIISLKCQKNQETDQSH